MESKRDEQVESAPADGARREAPPRPPFSSGVAAHEKKPMPFTIRMATWFIIFSAVTFTIFTALAAADVAEMRAQLQDELAAQAPTYPASDIASAVKLVLIAALVAGALLVLGELLCARYLHWQKRGARVAFVVLVALHIPVLVVIQSLRNVDGHGTLSTAMQGGALALALIVLLLPSTSAWLAEQRR